MNIFLENYLFKNKILEQFWYDLYDIWFVIFDITLNYCPPYYQLMYCYFPAIYYYRRKKASRNNWINFFEDSSINYIFCKLTFFLKKFFSINIIIAYFKKNFQKIWLFFKLNFIKKINPTVQYFYYTTKNSFFTFFWRPVFKKISYHGLYSYIRTKWYKK